MEGWDNACRNIVHPDSAPGLLVSVRGKQALSVLWVGFLEIFANDVALIERTRGAIRIKGRQCQGRDEATGVGAEERGRFVIRIHFYVLVWDGLFFENNPGPLD